MEATQVESKESDDFVVKKVNATQESDDFVVKKVNATQACVGLGTTAM